MNGKILVPLFETALIMYKDLQYNPDEDSRFMSLVYTASHRLALEHGIVLSLQQWTGGEYHITAYHETWYDDTDVTDDESGFDTIAETYIDAIKACFIEMENHKYTLKPTCKNERRKT